MGFAALYPSYALRSTHPTRWHLAEIVDQPREDQGMIEATIADEGTLGLAKTLCLVAFLLMQGDIQWLIN
jgi:hypothetical protein